MSEVNKSTAALIESLVKLFGSYRAEWSREDMFRHFSMPAYFPDLVNFRPCVLQGGRGSGKTTVLQGLSYRGQYKFLNNDIRRFDSGLTYVGLYYKIDTNHVRALRGREVGEDVWCKLFGHYFNLVILSDIVLFLKWHAELSPDDAVLPQPVIREVLRRACINDVCENYEGLLHTIDGALCDFQNFVNNIGGYDPSKIQLSVIGEPIDYFFGCLRKMRQFSNKYFYILLDEYENFEDYQQVVINTMIKHAADNFTFKIGVKEAGWRVKHTLAEDETLYDPADYALIDINEKLGEGNKFYEFAKGVCEKRFRMLEGGESFDAEKSLEDLTVEEMAVRLGVEKTKELQDFERLPRAVVSGLGELPAMYKYTIAHWAITHGKSLENEVREVIARRKKWDTRYDNYKYHFLFKIRTGRGSGRHQLGQMLYCGFNTYVKLASNNIRFLMELMCKTFVAHLSDGNGLMTPVSAETQTIVARKIGEKNLGQLECVEKDGVRIVNLLCGLGRVFETLAKVKGPGRPEVNQFCVEGDIQEGGVEWLLNVAVKNMALVRYRGNKLLGAQTKAYDYSVHPIFAPFFTFSYRRKRKLALTSKLIDALANGVETPIDEVMQAYKKEDEEDAPVKTQMTFGL